MAVTVLKHAAGIVAGTLVGFSTGFTYAATLKQNLGIWHEVLKLPAEITYLVVTDPMAALPPVARPRPVTSAQTGTLPPAVAPSAQPPSAAEIAGKMLAPKASDPDVPLPLPELADKSAADAPLDGPRLFGRSEPGGGVLGLRVPIPADRGRSRANTRYSPGR